ncbi:protein tilB homolog isoform X2 [Ceratina calcarata]|uniref:Protein tilB homolog isoform X2 n=1 Tax=Ceratina calcarata TaxID=156304 RepID=A0AAJ7N8R5_9HYME|nr:protein tilB homolog isoform X2 [Ceratina calcarata]
MSRITLDLLRKRSEHNEGEISTLEEIALHQENIEKIELIDKVCKHLKILLLQHNLIRKIENLGRLKSLEYLNLALNNIEAIENLEGLESLKKLDLTVNFIGDLRGVKKLRCNEHLEQLFLMGNPCTDYEGYRKYVVASLTQLKELDGTPIERSERIKALQVYSAVEGGAIRDYARYRKTREAEVLDYQEKMKSETREVSQCCEGSENEEEEDDEKFWKRKSRHTPEERMAIAERVLRKQERRNREKDKGKHQPAYVLKLFSPEGKPYNMNQPKVPFALNEEEYNDRIILEVNLYKHLDTSYVDVDVQPEYVRVTIKGKVLQLTLPCEVSVDSSTAQRNSTNGKLVITMPRLKPIPVVQTHNDKEKAKTKRDQVVKRGSGMNVREYLEIGPTRDDLDFSKIVESSTKSAANREEELECDDNFDVPPLE